MLKQFTNVFHLRVFYEKDHCPVSAFPPARPGVLSKPVQTLRHCPIQENGIFFIINPDSLKTEITRQLISNSAAINFEKIEIIKMPVLGMLRDSLFALRISSAAKKATISRTLKLEDDLLYLDDAIIGDYNLNLIYQICQSKDYRQFSCEPNVIEMDGKRMWICGTDAKCVLPGYELECKSSSSVITGQEKR